MSLVQKLDDRLNPIVVKELRQAVKGRFIIGVFSLFLMISLITVVVFLIDSQHRSRIDYNAGRDVFSALHGILTGTCLLFLPLYAAVRFASERSDVNVDLMFITTIPPRAVIWGKFLATSILVGLIYSACTPFMMLTFMMRGVDLPTITLLLSYSFVIVLLGVGLGIFSACLTNHRGFRVIVALGFVFSLIWGFVAIIATSEGVLRWGWSSMIGSVGFWPVAGSFLLAAACALWLLFAWSVALIKPPSANRALGVRVSMAAIWLIGLGAALGLAYLDGSRFPIKVWALLASCYLSLYFLVAISERQRWGPRVRRSIPRRTVPRILAFLFYSGGAGGLLWTLSLYGLTLSILFALTDASTSSSPGGTMGHEPVAFLVTFPLYVLCYSLVGLWIHRQFLSKYVRQENAWVVAVITAASFCLLPPVLGYLVLGGDMDSSPWWALSGPVAIAFSSIRAEAIVFVSIGAILGLAAALPWMVRQWLEFRPLETAFETARSSGSDRDVSPEMAPFADLDDAMAEDVSDQNSSRESSGDSKERDQADGQ